MKAKAIKVGLFVGGVVLTIVLYRKFMPASVQAKLPV